MNKELYSVPAIATYIGTGLSLWSFFGNHIYLSFVSLGFVIAILGTYLLVVYKKYKNLKSYKSVDSQLHRLCHRTRDYVTLIRCADNKNEVMSMADSALKNALTCASKSFSRITGSECSASLMLLREDGTLKTVLYCHDADPQRESKPSEGLDSTSGVAGEALSTGSVVSWDKGDSKFTSIRDNYENFYQSGITAPFKCGFDYCGLLNVDSLKRNAFDAKEYREFAALFADSLGIIIGAKDLWVELK